MKTCKHNRTWLLAGGFIEWCYQCGAIRKLKLIKPGWDESPFAPASGWAKPIPGQENPFEKWQATFK